MTNDEGMTKSEVQKPESANDSFWNKDAEWIAREEPVRESVNDPDFHARAASAP